MTVNYPDINSCEHIPLVKLQAGGSLIRRKPLVTSDSKHLIVPSNCDVKVFSILSGECTLIFNEHKSLVVSVQHNTKNHLQVFSCSEDGTVIKWDWTDGSALMKYELRIRGMERIVGFYAPTEKPWYAAVKLQESDHRLYSVLAAPPKKNTMSLVLRPVSAEENSIAFGFGGRFIAAILKHTLQLYDVEKKYNKCHKTGERLLTCVACHPNDYIVATGDNTGCIIIWTNALNSNCPIRSTYHWHSLPLRDVVFSMEGSYVYSGGGECVLYKQKLNSDAKRLVARLGLPIVHLALSPDNASIVTSHTDNVLQVISSQDEVVQVVQGLTRAHTESNEILPTGLLYDPLSRALVLNGKPGFLQFYSFHEDKQLFNVDIVGRNYISQERESIIFNTYIAKAAVHNTGLWLATVEYRDDHVTMPEICLKFWNFDQTAQKFILNTNVYLPHNKKINCLKFRPKVDDDDDSLCVNPMAITTSCDNRFKIWTLNENDKEKPNWSPELMGYFKDMPAGDASFSEDSSLVAVVFNYIITLWMPETVDLKATLFFSEAKDPIQHITFGSNNCSHLLIGHTHSSLIVWNVISCSMLWHVTCDVEVIAEDPLSGYIACFTKGGKLEVYDACESNCVLTLNEVSSSPVLSAVFVPLALEVELRKSGSPCCWQQTSRLYFINENQDLLYIGDKTIDERNQDTSKAKLQQSIPLTPFGLLQAEHSTSGVTATVPKQHAIYEFSKEENIEIADLPCPTHINPIALCTSLLASMTTQVTQKNEESSQKSKFAAKHEKESSDNESDSEDVSFRKCKIRDTNDDETLERNELPKLVLTDYSFLLNYI